MKRYTINVVASVAVASACQAVALAWTGPGGTPDDTLMRPMMLLVAVCGLIFGAIVVAIAWQAREWSPAMLAAGCLSMGIGGISRFAFADAGLGIGPGESIGWMPLLGMILGGCWFFLGVQTYWPTGNRQMLPSRSFIIAAVFVAIMMCGLLAFAQSSPPSERASRIIAGAIAPAYLYAAYRFFSVWRLLRAPSHLTIAIGAALFAPATMIVAAGGVPGLAPWEIELLVLACTTLPVAGFVVEQRSRPGLRTMVYGLLVPGPIDAMRRGRPRQMSRLVERIGAYDGALRGHTDRVADIATRIALQLGLDSAEVHEVMLASQLHDVGKLFVPRAIIAKQARLDQEELATMQRHSLQAAEMVARVDELAPAVQGIREHHERWAGGGYPDGLRGEAISRAARIVAVADVYDLLRSARAYKPEWGVAEALSQIEHGSGSAFEPRVVNALLRLVANSASTALPASQAEANRKAA